MLFVATKSLVLLMEEIARNDEDDVHAGAERFILAFAPVLREEGIYTAYRSHHLYHSLRKSNFTDIQRHID